MHNDILRFDKDRDYSIHLKKFTENMRVHLCWSH